MTGGSVREQFFNHCAIVMNDGQKSITSKYGVRKRDCGDRWPTPVAQIGCVERLSQLRATDHAPRREEGCTRYLTSEATTETPTKPR